MEIMWIVLCSDISRIRRTSEISLHKAIHMISTGDPPLNCSCYNNLIYYNRSFGRLYFASINIIIRPLINLWGYSNSPSGNKQCRFDMSCNCHCMQIYFMIFVYNKTGWILMRAWSCQCINVYHVMSCITVNDITIMCIFHWKDQIITLRRAMFA